MKRARDEIVEQNKKQNISPVVISLIDLSPRNSRLSILLAIKQKELWLSQFKEIRFHNMAGFNDDGRGADWTSIELDYHEHFTIKKELITVGDVADAYYRIKSHKFDAYYELFIGVKRVTLENGILEAWLDFDHGS